MATSRRGGPAEARETSETQALLNQVRAENKQLVNVSPPRNAPDTNPWEQPQHGPTPDELAEAKGENARLATQLANTMEHNRDLEQQLTEPQEELVASGSWPATTSSNSTSHAVVDDKQGRF